MIFILKPPISKPLQSLTKSAFWVVLLISAAAFANAQDAEPAWKQVLGGEIIAEPQAENSSVIAVCEGAAVRAFGASGMALWEYKAGGRLLPFLARSPAGTSYVCRTNGVLFAINRAGRLIWQQKLGENIAFSPIIGYDERIFLFFQKTIVCLTASGRRLWQADLESPIAVAPIPDKNGGFVTVLQDGSLLNFDESGSAAGIPLTLEPEIIIPLNDNKKSTLTIFPNGAIKLFRWYKEADIKIPPLKGKLLAVRSFNSDIAMLLSSGEITLWNEASGFYTTFQTQGITPGEKYNLIFNKEMIIVMSLKEAIAYNTTGNMLWRITPAFAASALPAVDEETGFVYYGGKDWILYAYKTAFSRTAHNANGIKKINEYGFGIPPDSTWTGFTGGGKKDFEDLLKIIRYDLQNGNAGNNEAFYTKILLGIAGGKNKFSESRLPECLKQRLEAIKLLGIIGSRETMPFLANLFLQERDLNVKSAIAETIGEIGCDNNTQALNAFSTVINGKSGSSNDRLLCAITAATGKLCRFMGPPESAAGTALLAAISEKSHSKLVRNAVKKEFDLLFKSNSR